MTHILNLKLKFTVFFVVYYSPLLNPQSTCDIFYVVLHKEGKPVCFHQWSPIMDYCECDDKWHLFFSALLNCRGFSHKALS